MLHASLSAAASTPRHTVEADLDALRRIGIWPEDGDKRLVHVPGADAEKTRRRRCSPSTDSRAALRRDPPGVALAVQVLARRHRRPRCSIASSRDGLAARPDRRARPGRSAARRSDQGGARRSPIVDLTGQLTMPELSALIASARLFIGCDTAPMHLAAAAGTPVVAWFGPSDEHVWGPWQVPHRVVASIVHPCRPCQQQRLRRQQQFRLPVDAAAGARVSRRSTNCSPRPGRRAAMRLGIVRQRYTPFGGAERFVERAIDALLERGVARPGVHARMARRASRAHRARRLQSVLRRQRVARRGLRARGARRARARPARRRADARAHRGLRHLPRGRRRASRVARRARARGRPRSSASRSRPIRITATCSPPRRRCSPIRRSRPSSASRRWCATTFAGTSPIPDEKLHVIYNAVDPREFSPGVREHRAATRARLGHRRRRCRCSCSSVRAMRARAYRSRCARSRGCPRAPGSSSSAATSIRRATRRSRAARACAIRVVFAGPQQDPRPYLGAADAFVLPTLYDPLSNAVLEALACGLPVVTSRRCGAGELVVAHDAGCDLRRRRRRRARRTTWSGCSTQASAREPRARAPGAVAALTPDAMTQRLLALYASLGAGT